MKSNEIWKDIPNYEGLYQVSNYCRIKSLERFKQNHSKMQKVESKILKPYLNNNGYYYVSLTKNGKTKILYIHRLIATAFIPNPNNYPCINHIDGNKLNNNISNLEWCSYKHNNEEAYRIGLKRTIPTNQYDLNGTFIKTWKSREEIKRELGLNPADIWRVCKGIRKTCGGYIWRYASE